MVQAVAGATATIFAAKVTVTTPGLKIALLTAFFMLLNVHGGGMTY